MREKDIEEKLVNNLDEIEIGLSLIERQKRVSTGIIDLFCRDRNGRHVIVEVKRNPNTNVLAQLAKYNMAFIKNGISKDEIRTILVAPKFSKVVEDTCEFFNFEMKIIPKKLLPIERIKLSNSFDPSDIKKLMRYIKREEFVNQRMVSRFLKLYHHTTLNLVNHLKENNLINVTYFGRSKVITLREN